MVYGDLGNTLEDFTTTIFMSKYFKYLNLQNSEIGKSTELLFFTEKKALLNEHRDKLVLFKAALHCLYQDLLHFTIVLIFC